MKINNSKFAQTAPRAAGSAKVFFFCGPDEAGAHGAAARIVELLPDPGERVDIEGSELKRDPVRLCDETRSTSLFGDRRHIIVRAQGEEAHDALKILTDAPEAEVAQGWPVIVIANGATDKSRSAKLLERRDDALVAMFYPPDLRSVTAEVRRLADGAGLRMGAELAQRIAASVALDTRMAAAEVQKLALYLDADSHAPRSVTAEDIDAIGAETDDDGVMPLVDAVISGDVARLPHELSRFRQHGLNPVGTVLAMERRVAQLTQIAARIRPGENIAKAVENDPRIFFKERAAIARQMQQWHGPRLARLSDRLIALHRALLADSQAAPLLFAAGCTEIARAADARR